MGFWREQRVYAQHAVAMFLPGKVGGIHDADPNRAGEIDDWSPEEQHLLIEEGRRQIDRQVDDLERVRTRAQVLLALALALVGTTGALLDSILTVDHPVLWTIWGLAVFFGAWAAIGAAATSTVAAEPEIIHATALSTYSGPIEKLLARDYAGAVVAGENHVAVRLTNFRWAVAYLLACGALTLGSWTWSEIASGADAPPPDARCEEQTASPDQSATPCLRWIASSGAVARYELPPRPMT